MPRPSTEEFTIISDFSGAVQRKSTKFLKAKNEVVDANNARFFRTGGISKAPGYTQKGNDLAITNTSTSSSTSSSTSTSTSTSTSSSSSSSTSTSSTTTP